MLPDVNDMRTNHAKYMKAKDRWESTYSSAEMKSYVCNRRAVRKVKHIWDSREWPTEDQPFRLLGRKVTKR